MGGGPMVGGPMPGDGPHMDPRRAAMMNNAGGMDQQQMMQQQQQFQQQQQMQQQQQQQQQGGFFIAIINMDWSTDYKGVAQFLNPIAQGPRGVYPCFGMVGK